MSLPDAYLPEHMRDAMKMYLEHGVEPGGFLYAVLTNNLKEAFARADHINTQHLGNIVSYCMWEIPSDCWGSVEKVREYMNRFKGGSSEET